MNSPQERNSGFLPDQHDHGDCVAAALEDAIAVCGERGVRLTPVRRRVLEIIWQGHRPLGAYAILEVLSGEGHSPGTAHGLSRARVPAHPGAGAPAVVAERLRRLLPSRPSGCGAVPAVHRLRHGSRAQRPRDRTRDRARRGRRGLRLPGSYRGDQRALPALPRRLTDRWRSLLGDDGRTAQPFGIRLHGSGHAASRMAFVEFGPPVRARRRILATGKDSVILGSGLAGRGEAGKGSSSPPDSRRSLRRASYPQLRRVQRPGNETGGANSRPNCRIFVCH